MEYRYRLLIRSKAAGQLHSDGGGRDGWFSGGSGWRGGGAGKLGGQGTDGQDAVPLICGVHRTGEGLLAAHPEEENPHPGGQPGRDDDSDGGQRECQDN